MPSSGFFIGILQFWSDWSSPVSCKHNLSISLNTHNLNVQLQLHAYIGKRKIITFAFHFFHFKTFSGKVKKWFFHFFHFHFRFWKVKFEKWKNHFSTFPEKVLKWKKWKAKVKSESDYFSRSNVWLHVRISVSKCITKLTYVIS